MLIILSIIVILLGSFIFLIFRNNNKTSSITETTSTIKNNENEIYNKLKNYFIQNGISDSCLKCLYPKLKAKYLNSDFDNFFNNLESNTVENNAFVSDFFEFGNDCKCK